MTDIRKNEVYFAEVTFVDSNESKKRPVVVLSNNQYNREAPDVIVCGITTNASHNCYCPIGSPDLSYGNLFSDSGVRVDMLSRINKNKLQVKIGKITDEYHKKILVKIVELIG